MSHYDPDEALEFAPIAFLILDEDHGITYANRVAVEILDCEVEMNFKSFIHPNSRSAYEDLWDAESTGSTHIQMLGGAGTRYLELTGTRRPKGGRYLWISDRSEARALRSQLQRMKQPGRRFLYDLSNVLTTSIGYTELIQMMTNEEDDVRGESLANVRRYLGELRLALKDGEKILDNERRGHVGLKSDKVTPVNRRHVLIVDDEPGVGEFLGELMRGRQHKVTVFTEGHAALEFFRQNSNSIDLAIVDQTMPGITGIGVATEMLSLVPGLPIILCTGDDRVIADQREGRLNIRHFISKPIDINDLMDVVGRVLKPD